MKIRGQNEKKTKEKITQFYPLIHVSTHSVVHGALPRAFSIELYDDAFLSILSARLEENVHWRRQQEWRTKKKEKRKGNRINTPSTNYYLLLFGRARRYREWDCILYKNRLRPPQLQLFIALWYGLFSRKIMQMEYPLLDHCAAVMAKNAIGEREKIKTHATVAPIICGYNPRPSAVCLFVVCFCTHPFERNELFPPFARFLIRTHRVITRTFSFAGE